MSLQVRYFLIAVQFFTRIPLSERVTRWTGFHPSWITRCVRFFPLVGLLVGGAVALLYALLYSVFYPWPAVFITIAFGVLLTGAFHEDGWADFCDGMGGTNSNDTKQREKILEIMRDSRVGTYGALGLILMMIIKAAFLVELSPLQFAATFIIASVVSRGVAVVVMVKLPYAESQAALAGRTKPIAQDVQAGDWFPALISCAVTLAAGLTLGFIQGFWHLRQTLIAAVFVTVTLVWMLRQLRQRLGGYNGDSLGATQQLSELAIIAGLCAR